MMMKHSIVTALVGVLGASSCWAFQPKLDPKGQLLKMFPSAKFYEPYSRTLTIFGTPMVRGADPQDAARLFLSEHADVFGSEFADLVLDREIKLLKNRAVVFYRQEYRRLLGRWIVDADHDAGL